MKIYCSLGDYLVDRSGFDYLFLPAVIMTDMKISCELRIYLTKNIKNNIILVSRPIISIHSTR